MVKSIDFFIMFLSMTDKNEFEKKKKQIVKISDPKKLEEIKHLEGRAIVKVDSGKSILGRTILQFSTGIQTLFEKLMKANDDTVKAMKLTELAFEYEAQAYKELTAAYSSINVIFYYINSQQKFQIYSMV